MRTVDPTATETRTPRAPSETVSRLSLVPKGPVLVLAVIVVAGALVSPYFATWSNVLTMLTSASVIGIISVGMTFVIISGGIDLSVGALVALTAVMATTAPVQEGGWVAMIAVALAFGLGAGLVNGLVITHGRIVPFIATLAMLVSARGLAEFISGGTPQTSLDETFNALGSAKLVGIPLPVWVFAAVVAVGWLLLNRTTFGRHTLALGGNLEAARLAGIRIRRHLVILYMLSGLTAAIASVLLTARLTSGSNAVGNLYELDAIAAVIIGGTRLAGGRGTIAGSVFGVLIFTVITNIFVLKNLETDVQNIAKGAIIVAAVLLQRRRAADT
ncbi:ABC transporter permease [Nonomuraea rhizosphaerae]|uniref:ABC transporter permease n=1 Tax=Nonomuraea rhizosphaerae TaxID=2665663 RepID=UPI0027E2B1CA|nr:ABC transporter permease [Nonomuraea rhizosphaerae]